ncbi:hypothetical protein [Xanthomonas sp. NCPPB 2632]|uniref:hypothetical protein n=1 Tax=Xanthomonas sp. NCPPB 2632 TaxID=3240912 RepID=UPI003517525B
MEESNNQPPFVEEILGPFYLGDGAEPYEAARYSIVRRFPDGTTRLLRDEFSVLQFGSVVFGPTSERCTADEEAKKRNREADAKVELPKNTKRTLGEAAQDILKNRAVGGGDVDPNGPPNALISRRSP